MLERDLLQWILSCAKATHWKCYHVPAPMVADRKSGAWRPSRGAAGLPDLFLLCDDPPRLIIAEVKGDGGKLSDKQQEFLQAAKRVADISTKWETEDDGLVHLSRLDHTLGVYVWTPKDMSIIETILKTKVLL